MSLCRASLSSSSPSQKGFWNSALRKRRNFVSAPVVILSTDVGPLIRPQHVQRMSDLVSDAVARGARVLCGGKPRPDLGPNFFEPTVIAGVNSSMKLFQEETFGPILAVQSVKDAEAAVALANDSTFALAASVWTNDAKRGQAIAVQSARRRGHGQ